MTDRRQLLADTALQIIGEHGIRALTHHRVDDGAGLARGSTSYYCRRRIDLLTLALHRLLELDVADMQAAFAPLSEAPTLDEIHAAAAPLIGGWLQEPARTRSVARIELFMAASHEPQLQPLLAEQRGAIIELLSARFGASIGDDSGRRLGASLMLLDGLMLSVLRQGAPAPSERQIAELLRLLRA